MLSPAQRFWLPQCETRPRPQPTTRARPHGSIRANAPTAGCEQAQKAPRSCRRRWTPHHTVAAAGPARSRWKAASGERHCASARHCRECCGQTHAHAHAHRHARQERERRGGEAGGGRAAAAVATAGESSGERAPRAQQPSNSTRARLHAALSRGLWGVGLRPKGRALPCRRCAALRLAVLRPRAAFPPRANTRCSAVNRHVRQAE